MLIIVCFEWDSGAQSLVFCPVFSRILVDQSLVFCTVLSRVVVLNLYFSLQCLVGFGSSIFSFLCSVLLIIVCFEWGSGAQSLIFCPVFSRILVAQSLVFCAVLSGILELNL